MSARSGRNCQIPYREKLERMNEIVINDSISKRQVLHEYTHWFANSEHLHQKIKVGVSTNFFLCYQGFISSIFSIVLFTHRDMD